MRPERSPALLSTSQAEVYQQLQTDVGVPYGHSIFTKGLEMQIVGFGDLAQFIFRPGTH
jgi:hypothetical protein